MTSEASTGRNILVRTDDTSEEVKKEESTIKKDMLCYWITTLLNAIELLGNEVQEKVKSQKYLGRSKLFLPGRIHYKIWNLNINPNHQWKDMLINETFCINIELLIVIRIMIEPSKLDFVNTAM